MWKTAQGSQKSSLHVQLSNRNEFDEFYFRPAPFAKVEKFSDSEEKLCWQFLVYQMAKSTVVWLIHASRLLLNTQQKPRESHSGPTEQRSNKNATNFFFLLSFSRFDYRRILAACSEDNNNSDPRERFLTSCNEVSIAIIVVLLLPQRWLIDFVSHSRHAAPRLVTYRSLSTDFIGD